MRYVLDSLPFSEVVELVWLVPVLAVLGAYLICLLVIDVVSITIKEVLFDVMEI